MVVNAMTIDVEDYFHVSVFDGVVPRSDWATMESRVCRNTIRLLDLFAEHDLLATFLGVRADRLRGIVARWRTAGYVATGSLARISVLLVGGKHMALDASAAAAQQRCDLG